MRERGRGDAAEGSIAQDFTIAVSLGSTEETSSAPKVLMRLSCFRSEPSSGATEARTHQTSDREGVAPPAEPCAATGTAHEHRDGCDSRPR